MGQPQRPACMRRQGDALEPWAGQGLCGVCVVSVSSHTHSNRPSETYFGEPIPSFLHRFESLQRSFKAPNSPEMWTLRSEYAPRFACCSCLSPLHWVPLSALAVAGLLKTYCVPGTLLLGQAASHTGCEPGAAGPALSTPCS